MEELRQKEEGAAAKKKMQGKQRSRKRMQDKTVNKAEQVHTSLQFDTLPISSSGWMGQRYSEQANASMKRKWRDRSIQSEMLDFKRVSFNEQ